MKNEKEVKIAMISAASLAMKYAKKNPNHDSEQVIKHIIKSYDAKGDRKIAGIAAANHVLKLREKNPRITEKQAMQNLSDSMNSILDNINCQENAPVDILEK